MITDANLHEHIEALEEGIESYQKGETPSRLVFLTRYTTTIYILSLILYILKKIKKGDN